MWMHNDRFCGALMDADPGGVRICRGKSVMRKCRIGVFFKGAKLIQRGVRICRGNLCNLGAQPEGDGGRGRRHPRVRGGFHPFR